MTSRIAFFILLFFPSLLFAQTTAKVIKIVDGDTFVILTDNNKKVRVRFHGIDSPEYNQQYGDSARKFTTDRSLNKTVRLIEKGYDPYDRLLAVVMLDDSTCLNELLLINGWAWHYRKYDQNPKWYALSDSAKANKVGLWKRESPVPPWVYRRNKY